MRGTSRELWSFADHHHASARQAALQMEQSLNFQFLVDPRNHRVEMRRRAGESADVLAWRFYMQARFSMRNAAYPGGRFPDRVGTGMIGSRQTGFGFQVRSGNEPIARPRNPAFSRMLFPYLEEDIAPPTVFLGRAVVSDDEWDHRWMVGQVDVNGTPYVHRTYVGGYR